MQSLWQIPIIGHRGACALAPENTLASLIKAYELGLSWIEFDVMLTKDSQPVVIHDATLRRTTNGSGRVSAKTFKQLALLDAGSWFNKDYQGERIPHLDDYLTAANNCHLNVNVELKPVTKDEKLTAKLALESINQNFDRKKFDLIISSFSENMLTHVRKLDNEIKLGFLMHRWRRNYARIAKKLNCYSIHVNQVCLNKKRIQEIKQQGYYLLSYTVNNPKRAQQLLEWGVDAVFSDMPHSMHHLIKK